MVNFKVKIDIDGEWHVMTWNELHDAIAFGNDLRSNRKIFCTGKLDRNGKDIYEGDISMPGIGEIFWDVKYAMFRVKWHDKVWRNARTPIEFSEPLLTNPLAFDIIGNIYEDHEILDRKLPINPLVAASLGLNKEEYIETCIKQLEINNPYYDKEFARQVAISIWNKRNNK